MCIWGIKWKYLDLLFKKKKTFFLSFFLLNYSNRVLGVLGHGALGCSALRGCGDAAEASSRKRGGWCKKMRYGKFDIQTFCPKFYEKYEHSNFLPQFLIEVRHFHTFCPNFLKKYDKSRNCMFTFMQQNEVSSILSALLECSRRFPRWLA
jgi:hypothetical protein